MLLVVGRRAAHRVWYWIARKGERSEVPFILGKRELRAGSRLPIICVPLLLLLSVVS
jgi:hypothetical protein